MPVLLTTPRILLVGLPKLTADLVAAAISLDPEAEIVGVVDDPAEMATRVEQTGANVLIVGSNHGELPTAVRELPSWSMPPDTAVVPLDQSGVVLHLVRRRAVALGDISSGDLIAAIRARLADRVTD